MTRNKTACKWTIQGLAQPRTFPKRTNASVTGEERAPTAALTLRNVGLTSVRTPISKPPHRSPRHETLHETNETRWYGGDTARLA
ncbi:hypothetical protein MTO96_035818 [Rhipicephalus appendiculatus]